MFSPILAIYFSNELYMLLFQTANDFLQEVIDAVNSLEQTGRYIQNHTDELFDVTVNNTRYTIADENPIIYAGVSCTVGFVAIDGICGMNKYQIVHFILCRTQIMMLCRIQSFMLLLSPM
jgi:hypothetical protein